MEGPRNESVGTLGISDDLLPLLRHFTAASHAPVAKPIGRDENPGLCVNVLMPSPRMQSSTPELVVQGRTLP